MDNTNELTIKEIQDKYREIYANRSGAIVFDGVVNVEKYENILFLLKEANQEKSNASETKPINDNLNENTPWKMWIRAAEWVYGISRTTENELPPYSSLNIKPKEKHDELLHEEIKKIAVININKADGVGSPSQKDIEKRLAAAVASHSELLRREIELAEPRVIICGGTFWYLKEIFKDAKLRCNGYKASTISNIGKLRDVLIIDYCHPGARLSALMEYYGITNIYQRALIEGWKK